MNPIVLWLTIEQQASVMPFMEKAREMADAGKPGIVAAQVFPDHIRIGILSNEVAKQAVLAQGGDATQTCRSAPIEEMYPDERLTSEDQSR